MKTIFFLLSFIPFISIELNAQQDNPEITEKDSLITLTTDILKPDTNFYPPFILPLDPEPKLTEFKTEFVSYHVDSGCHPKGAKKDLKNGEAIIWFPGGIFGCDFSSKADQEFQNRYQVRFVSPGCGRFGDEDPDGYNQVIFQYLDKKYGTGWRDELRHDATGFKKPIISVAELTSPLAIQLANPKKIYLQSLNPETETSVWWYILPTSGFALLVSLYLIKKRKN